MASKTGPRSRKIAHKRTQLSGLLTVEETANFLRLAQSTLNRWRWSGEGPRFVKMGGCVRYRASDLCEYVANKTRGSTSEY